MLNDHAEMRQENQHRELHQRRDTVETHWLPWARFNLHRNPFGELLVEERATLAVLEECELEIGGLQSKEAIQLIRDCGRGKTTRLLAIRHRV